MDGVLADFASQAIKAHGWSGKHDDIYKFNMEEIFGITISEFWSKCWGYDFWYDIKPYPWAEELIRECRKLGDLIISTSPSADKDCIPAKQQWLYDHFGIKVTDCMFGSKKYLMANPKTTLIDDYPLNIEKFANNNGNTLLFRQPWNLGGISYDYKGIIEMLSLEE